MTEKCLKCGTPLLITSSVYIKCFICGAKYKVTASGSIEKRNNNNSYHQTQNYKNCQPDEVKCENCFFGEECWFEDHDKWKRIYKNND